MDKLRDFISEQQIANVRAAKELATWLPNSTFTSSGFFQLEVDKLFSRTWISVGFVDDVRDPGDAYPLTTLGGIPLVMVRDEEGELRVFHNICPHDGCPAIWSPKKLLSRIVGIYHGWVWNLDGSLRDATLFDGTSKVQTLPDRDADLKEVRSSVWQGVVFVNLSGDAEAFDQYIAPVDALYAEADLSGLVTATTLDGSEAMIDRFTFEGNWKSVYENFAINVNHEGCVHTEYKAAPNVPRVTIQGERTYEEIDDRGYHGLKFSSVEAELAYGLPATPKLNRKDGGPYNEYTIMTLYPNTNISLFANHMVLTVLSPHAPDSTGYDTIIRIPEAVDSDARYFEKCKDMLYNDWGYARDEDAEVIKRVQQGRVSPAYDQHFLSPFWEGMTYGFNNRILNDLDRD